MFGLDCLSLRKDLFGWVFFSNRLVRLYRSGVAADVANELFAQGVLDHACMHALKQFSGRELLKGAAKGGLTWQCKTQIKAAQAAQFAVRLQAIDQSSGGL